MEDNNGSIRITQESNGQRIADYECNTTGRECEIKEAGHVAKVSMWFNGAKLVEMRTRGSEVIKRRFQVTGDGNMMEMEVIPIAPDGRSKVIHMSRLRTEGNRKPQQMGSGPVSDGDLHKPVWYKMSRLIRSIPAEEFGDNKKARLD